jgi:Tetrapyrrole (Corrin/Porphyrin) Methylases
LGDNPAGAFTAFGLKAEGEPIRPGLHVVATPIGHLGDISFRALATLAAAEAVIAEDMRVTKKLLAHYGISTPLVAYHEHNAEVVRPHLLARLAGGAALALVSDAGTPLISDPGFNLVADALAQNIEVMPVPGASAVLAALVVAGLPTDRFFFEGFLPPKSAARRARIAELAAVPFQGRSSFSSPRAAWWKRCATLPPFSGHGTRRLPANLQNALRPSAAHLCRIWLRPLQPKRLQKAKTCCLLARDAKGRVVRRERAPVLLRPLRRQRP